MNPATGKRKGGRKPRGAEAATYKVTLRLEPNVGAWLEARIRKDGFVKPDGTLDRAGWFRALIHGQLSSEVRINALRQRLREARDMVNGDFWFWQGDGGDNLESLVCPVVIQPDDLAALISRKPE